MKTPSAGSDRTTDQSLRSGFLRSAALRPEAPALVVDDHTFSYGELEHLARKMAAALFDGLNHRPARVGVFACRSATAYAGTLAALFAGATFVPLNRNFPPGRSRGMIQRAGVDALIVDRESSAQLGAVLAGMASPPLVLVPEEGPLPSLLSGLRALRAADIDRGDPLQALPQIDADDAAYLLFTSGSTGEPKGVPITHANVGHFLDAVARRYDFTPEDRFSQTFDPTFDLSVFDMFAAWQCGARVCAARPLELLAPHRFVNKHSISVWFSVPSVAVLMRRKNFLQPNIMPSLRWSLFCGEPLTRDIASAWRLAAPHAELENLYGPTELTIACFAYRWDDRRSPAECVNDVVLIGKPFAGLSALVVDEALQPVRDGQAGELCVCGPQTFPGYWNDAARTVERFLPSTAPHSQGSRFYRTGDCVLRTLQGEYAYLGRIDHQIKVLGHRVELGEIEAALRRDPRVAEAVALGWPLEAGAAQSVVAFVTGAAADPEGLVGALRAQLPAYMVPRALIVLEVMPLNANGKVDRLALLRRLERSTDPEVRDGG